MVSTDSQQRAIRIARVSASVAVLFSAMLIGGCGGGHQLSTAPVRGKVTFNNRPVASAQVIFTPERGRAATGQTGEDGSFVLSTYKNGDGAIIGHHRVTVMALGPPAEGQTGPPGIPVPGPSTIPEAYSSTATSGLAFDVRADGDNVFDIVLSSQPSPR
jgi:hypothetical protein